MAAINQDMSTETGTPKCKHNDVSMASPSSDTSSPDAKRANQLEEFDLSQMPNDDASVGEWSKFMVKQLTVLNSNMQKIAHSSNFAADQASDAMKEISAVSTSMGKLTMKLVSLRNENVGLKKEVSDLNEKILSQEFYARRENLRFDGIREHKNETDFDCYNKVVQAIQCIPELNQCAEFVRISRCHRVGPFVPNQTRPIIAHFHWYGDRNLILSRRSQLPRGVYVSEDYPDEINDRWAHLRPIFSAAVKHPEFKGKVKRRRDQLIIKGKVYTVRPVNNLDELPEPLNPVKVCTCEDDQTLAFLGSGAPPSNFHDAPFTVDNTPFVNNEQYIQKGKADLFGDEVMAAKIMKETSPYKIKKLGDRVKNVIPQQWEQEGPKIAEKGALAKFRQNTKAREYLLSTGNKTIVEASADRFWGCGVKLSDNRVLCPGQYTGQNKMGKVIEKVRQTLRSEIIQNA